MQFRAIILFTLFSLVGCQQSNAVQPPISSPTTIISTNTLISIPSPSLTPAATITLTPLPTLQNDKALAKFDQLYSYNNGCKLPCWWGIMPGITTWSAARNFLMQFNEIGSIEENPFDKHSSKVTLAYFQIPSPGFNHPEGTRAYFKIQNGVVVAITLLEDIGGKMFDMHKLYMEYGEPDSVRVRLQGCLQDASSCWAEVFYEYDDGFLSQTQAHGTVNGTTVSLCIPPWDYGLIYMWASGATIDLINYGENKHNFISLTEDNQKQISELFTTNEFFTKGYHSPDFETCLDVHQQ